MCEFKVIKQNNGSQVAEDILVLSYTENNELVVRDILGSGAVFDSALILDVNTISQECKIIEHPIIKLFVELVKSLADKKVSKELVERVQLNLEKIKNEII